MEVLEKLNVGHVPDSHRKNLRDMLLELTPQCGMGPLEH